jgi:hypothetical protein
MLARHCVLSRGQHGLLERFACVNLLQEMLANARISNFEGTIAD